MKTYLGAFDSMVMSGVNICEDTILILQTTISADRWVRDRRERTMRSKFCAEWPRDIWSYKGCYLIVKRNISESYETQKTMVLASLVLWTTIEASYSLCRKMTGLVGFCRVRIYLYLLMSSVPRSSPSIALQKNR